MTVTAWIIDPDDFDGGKFAALYGLNATGVGAAGPDFWIEQRGLDVYVVVLPSIVLPNPPTFQPPDPPMPGFQLLSGTGDPNGVVVGSPGDIYSNVAGGAGVTLWVKESGMATNLGWVAK